MVTRAKMARIKRPAVIEALERFGGMTRVEIEEHFQASRTTIQFHLTSMRAEGAIFIREWREPTSTGSWSPVWTLRTSPEQKDAPLLVPNRRVQGEEAIVVQASGIKNEHARIARARHEQLGMWGQLVRVRCRAA